MWNSELALLIERTYRVLGLLLVTFLNCMSLSEATERTDNLIELQVELPKPVSMGTPFDGFRPNLEKMDYVERPPLMAPAETQIVSRNKPVSSSAEPLRGTLAQIVDGRKGHEEDRHIELPPGLQWVQVDLELQVEIQAIYLWQYRRGVRVYFDVIGLISTDPEFKTGVTQFYNNDFDNSAGFGTGSDPEYFETYKGRQFALSGVRGRYVRFYSQGHFHGESNDYVELEVWGKNAAPDTSLPLAPLDFQLPEPFFGGTPFDWGHPNMEWSDFKEREPTLAPPGTRVVSREKPVTSSATPLVGKLDQVTDGNKNHEDENVVELPEGLQWVQVDLEEECQLYAVLLWHYHHGMRVYFDVIGQLSNDPKFNVGVTTIYNNDDDNSAGFGAGPDKLYLDQSPGRLIALDGLSGRYVRFYSNGNTSTNSNHVVEIEVWGQKLDK